MQNGAEAILSIEVTCDECKRKPRPTSRIDVFMEMAPRMPKDDPFYLCVGCWMTDYARFDGARVVEIAPPPVVIAAPVASSASRKSRKKS